MNNLPDDAPNLLGALSLLVNGVVRAAVTGSAGAAGALPEALIVIKDRPGVIAEWLGSVLGLSQPGIAQLVRRLVQLGWVERRSGIDGRSYALHLTAAGLGAARKVLQARHQALAETLRPLTTEQRDQLIEIAQTLLRPRAGDDRHLARLCRLCDRARCGTCPVHSDDLDYRCPQPERATGVRGEGDRCEPLPRPEIPFPPGNATRGGPVAEGRQSVTSDDQRIEVGHGVGVLRLTVQARGQRSAAVLTPDEADQLADRLREQAVLARNFAGRFAGTGQEVSVPTGRDTTDS